MSRDRTVELHRDGLTFVASDTGPRAGAPTVVLLHGFPGGRSTWDHVTDRLATAGVRCIALEQRGYGARARPTHVDAYRLPTLAADVTALVDHLELGPCHLVGHDWGGIVAWQLAATQGAAWRSATVLSTPHPHAFAAALTRGAQGLRSTYAVAFQVPVLPEVLLTAHRGRVLRTALVASGLDAVHARRYAEHLAPRGAMRAALDWYRASFRHPGDLRSVGPSVVPTTYVWSTGDVALGRSAAVRTADHVASDYRFIVLDGVSHWIPETEPDRTSSIILDAIG